MNLTGWITNFTSLGFTRSLIVSVHDTMPVPGANIQTKETRINTGSVVAADSIHLDAQ